MCYIIIVMKVHFACSTSKLNEYKTNYRKICGLIRDMGHTILRDWIEEAIKIVESDSVNILDREDVYSKVTASLFASDAVVIEGTIASFSVGHQVTLALSKNKPVLFLVTKRGTRNKTKHSFLGGISSPLLKVMEYDDSNIADILNDFLNNNGSKPVVKFNIVLTKEIESYLDWVSYSRKVNRSEFIRNLILDHMRNEDVSYRKQIEKHTI